MLSVYLVKRRVVKCAPRYTKSFLAIFNFTGHGFELFSLPGTETLNTRSSPPVPIGKLKSFATSPISLI